MLYSPVFWNKTISCTLKDINVSVFLIFLATCHLVSKQVHIHAIDDVLIYCCFKLSTKKYWLDFIWLKKKLYLHIYLYILYMYYLNIHMIVYNNIINHYQYELKSDRWWHVKVGGKNSFDLRMLTITKLNSMEQLEFLMVHLWIHILT